MKLYRILIVDDEMHVVDAMTSLLDAQTDLSLDLYTANSGNQAIEIMEKGKIDLLITDIQMPDMTGLELVDTVNKLWPFCKTVFLTAHANFNFAQEAIKKHVVSYILKTEDDETIVNEVKKALKSIDDDLDQKKVQHPNLIQLNHKRRDLFFSLLNEQVTNEAASQLLGRLGFRHSDEKIILIMGILNSSDDQDIRSVLPDNGHTYPDEFSIVNSILNYYLADWIRYSHCEIDDSNHYVWLIQLRQFDMPSNKPSLDEGIIRRLNGLLETVQTSCLVTAYIGLSFIISPPVLQSMQIASIFSASKIYLHKLSCNTELYVFNFDLDNRYQLVDHAQLKMLPIKSDQIDDQLIHFLESNDRQMCYQYIEDLSKSLMSTHAEVERNRADYDIIISTLLNFAIRNKLYEKSQFLQCYNELFHYWKFNDLHDYVKKIFQLSTVIFDLSEKQNDDLFNHTIEYITNYILDHIVEDISLLQLSNITGYNANYLSSFFYKQTGEHLNKYISRQKLALIKQMLQSTRLSIEEIAEKTGFRSRSYFNRFVKKETGLTPKNYRIKLLNSQY